VSPAQYFAALFANPANLPTVPKVVQQLIQSFSRDDVSVDEIASMLAADPVLSAKTLRLANSAYFHVSRSIGTVDDALRMLGFVMVRNLVVGCGVTAAFKPMPGVDLPQFWRYSLHTAGSARWLARAAGQNTDLAFMGGLMHGLGQLLMHAVHPDRMRPLDAECHVLAAERPEIELSTIGYHFGEVSAELALRWKFPEEVTEPLRYCTSPLQADPPSPMAAVLHIAMWRARVEALKLSSEEAGRTLPRKVAESLDLPLVWLPDQATVGGDHPALEEPMPALSVLCEGLESMLA
jgi:HD-like signal output (HDOD) protein